jgi:hypothetical protein
MPAGVMIRRPLDPPTTAAIEKNKINRNTTYWIGNLFSKRDGSNAQRNKRWIDGFEISTRSEYSGSKRRQLSCRGKIPPALTESDAFSGSFGSPSDFTDQFSG